MWGRVSTWLLFSMNQIWKFWVVLFLFKVKIARLVNLNSFFFLVWKIFGLKSLKLSYFHLGHTDLVLGGSLFRCFGLVLGRDSFGFAFLWKVIFWFQFGLSNFKFKPKHQNQVNPKLKQRLNILLTLLVVDVFFFSFNPHMGNNNYASSHKYNFNGVIYEMISYDTNLS